MKITVIRIASINGQEIRHELTAEFPDEISLVETRSERAAREAQDLFGALPVAFSAK